MSFDQFNTHRYVDANELRFIMIHLDEAIRPEDDEISELLAIADSDGDGKISYEGFYFSQYTD